MKLYDESINQFYKLLQEYDAKSLDITDHSSMWPDCGSENMILRSDMAYELGGGTLSALSSLSITDDCKLVPQDEVLLYGPDLAHIKCDIPYARITLVRVKEQTLGKGNQLYNAIRKLEYVRYHIKPKGYMMRISSSSQREPARIGKKELKSGLSFSKVGRQFIEAFHSNPNVMAVKIIFITLPDFPYTNLKIQVEKNEQITSAIDHITKDLIMDCNACNLKPICDEVEGMKELHFHQAAHEM